MDYVSYTITISALVIGIVANSTAICVIVNYPVEKKNRHFGILLLIQFIAGLLTSVFQSVFSFYLLIIENHLVYIFNIFDSYWYNFSLKRFFISFVFFFLYFNVVYVAGIVIARYYLVCKQNDLNLKQASSIFIFTIIPCICASLAIWITVNEGIPKNILGDWIKKNNISLIGISESTEAIAFDIGSISSYFLYALILSTFLVMYIIIILYVKKYKKHIASYSRIMSNKTLIINKQFMIILIFQSSVPAIITGIPIIFFVIMLIMENTKIVSTFGILLINLLMLVPCINPILFLGLSSTNRKYLCFQFKKFTNWLLCKKGNTGLVSSIRSQSNIKI